MKLYDLGISKNIIPEIHKEIDLLRHDIEFMPAKNKAHVRNGVRNKQLAISKTKDGMVGLIYKRNYHSVNLVIFESTGAIKNSNYGSMTNMSNELPNGKYFVRSLTDPGDFEARHRSDRYIHDFKEPVEKIYKRVYKLAERSLEKRVFDLQKKLASISSMNKDELIKIVNNKNKNDYSVSAYEKEDNFEQIIDNFKHATELLDEDNFEQHITDTIKRVLMTSYGITSFGYSSNNFRTSPDPNRWDGYHGNHLTVENEMSREISGVDPEKTEGQIINIISKRVVKFYSNLIEDDQEVIFMEPGTETED